MVKKVKQRVIKFLNRKIEYDKAIKFLYMFKNYRNSVNNKLSKYELSLDEINKKSKEDTVTIVFICQVPALWNGLRSVYESAKEHINVIPYIVAIPEKKINENYDVTKDDYGYNYSYDFCQGIYNNVINGYDSNTKEFYDLRKLNPTYVFLQRPYDIYLPKLYHSNNIKDFAKVCYIPYGYDITIGDSRLCYRIDFISNVYAIFTENEYYKNMISKIYETFGCLNSKRVFNLGYPRFDLYKTCTHIEDKKYKKTVLWLPRWTTDSEAEATTFFDYKDIIIRFFKEHQDIRLICRPHPLMLRNFVAYNLMSEAEAEEFLNIFKENSNFEYDLEGDYTISFRKADIFISDFSSLLVEELLMDIPIIYTGEVRNFDKASIKLSKGMYRARNESELIHLLEILANGNDMLAQARKKSCEMLALNNYSSGKKIIDALVSDYQGIGK